MSTDDSEFTTNSADPAYAPEPVTLEGIAAIMRNFTDRRPATLRAIKIHPDYFKVFAAGLRVRGVQHSLSPLGMHGVPIYKDPSVPYGKIKEVFAGDPE